MGWRFRKSFKIAPGVRWNIGKRGSSFSFGGKGFTVNVGKKGARTTVGIPGTGLSYSTQIKNQKTQRIQPPPLPISTPPMAMKKSGKWFYLIGGVLVGIWFVSRQVDTASRNSQPSAQPVVSRHVPQPTHSPSTLPWQESTPFVESTPVPTPTPLPTSDPAVVPAPESITTYRVVGVPAGDFLNLRTGPGQNYPIVQRLQNGLDGITLLGSPVNNDGTIWQKIDSRGTQGWAVLSYLVAGTVITVKPTIEANAQPTPVKESKPPSDNYVPTEVRLTSSTAFPVFEHGIQTGLSSPPIGTKVKVLKVTGYNVLVEYQGQQKSISATSTDLLQRMLGTADD
jgi:hypothetical protein